jgi:two-component system, chemotaxis family, CheB/CheR fusion protein
MSKPKPKIAAKRPSVRPDPPVRGGTSRPFPVVGIGASAGGLEAVKRLLARLPGETGMAYVLVPHLSPDHESLLPSILQKATPMPIVPVTDGVKIAPNRLYVLPPNAHMSIAGGHLRLVPRPVTAGSPLVIDFFLRSLAQEQGRQAIAIILSGTASDGSIGVRAVKAEGGIVFAQDEQSAVHGGMPHSAAATGVVDFVLPPEGIAEELARIGRHPYLARGFRPGAAAGEETSRNKIFTLLRGATGVDFSFYKPSTIWRRLARRMVLLKLDRIEAYVELLERTPSELRALHDDMLIHVTHFFREPKTFELLEQKVYPKLVKNAAPGVPIRVWVPGCSSGEEAYSLAISLLDFLGERADANPLQVFATDVSDAAVEKARAGIFPEGIANDVEPRLLRRYFTRIDRGYQVSKRVRDTCVFAKQNLAKDPPFANIDLISCRNVLIYLGPALQKRIIPIFHYALKPNGTLVLGNAESVGEFGNLFTWGDRRQRVYFKKNVPNGPRLDFGAAFQQTDEPAVKIRSQAPTAWPESDAQKVADRMLLARFAPAGVVINGDLEILHFRGQINRYLEPASGKASLNLLKMLPDTCHADVRALIHKAKKAENSIRERGVRLGEEGRTLVTIEAIPFRVPISGETHFIVLFHDESGRKPGEVAAPAPARRQSKKERNAVERISRELSSTKAHLQAIIEEHEASNEELKAANEEIISSNEELQSTNEELETAKEELQAANEELTTLNEELQNRNVELSETNNDLLNLLANVHLAIVMVSNELRIRRFTPLAEKLLNLIPGDVGRPIGDIKPAFAIPGFEDLIGDVIENVAFKELEVQDKSGRWYSLRMRPYKTMENKIEGAVLVFVDIDAVKRGVLDLRESAAFVDTILQSVEAPMGVLDLDLNVKAANPAMTGLLERPELREELERQRRVRGTFEDAVIRSNGKTLQVAARKLAADGRLFLLTIRES